MQLNILRRKAKSDIKISAVCCLNKRNYEELPKIIELCKRLGIDILRVQPLMKMGRAKEGLDAYSLSKMSIYKPLIIYWLTDIKIFKKTEFLLNGVIH